ncbi:hypothetical protein PHAVU_008G279100 [Phaseolus vulgaris]|uniref:Uncharacterized protein n=1 Tax=Phaseolus vulgaris TaxID=3885 RepID=V7B9A9_PHAVU|nr:hypothetical protein PHAVU_008G279100g [Phaseolus vulgaris]ESW14414.1 hypothetical protein PHAVU_008G279100g [Phaseolus vulgaris]
MFGAEFLTVVVITLWLLSESNFDFKAYGDALADVITTPTCENCPKTKCDDDPSCQQVTPPLSAYPSYGGASPPPSGYSVYGVPPPPPPHKTGLGQSQCPPAASVQCCTPPAPYTFGYGYGYGPPNPYYAPPNLYTYVPYGKGEGHASMILPFLAPLITLFSSFIFLL